ncbi:TPA: hypothetical protein ACH3X3_002526 [Trebouxia sp. C0006]
MPPICLQLGRSSLILIQAPNLSRLIRRWPFKLHNQTTMKRPEGPDWQTKLQQVLYAAAENKFVQVATVREDGTPACRTMGLAGFIPATQQALLQTHAKSYKPSHLAKNNWVEICKWNAASQQQFRLRGPVTVVDADSKNEAFQSLRQQEYKRLGTPSVLQWYHNADRAPGKPFQSPVHQTTDQQDKAPPSFLLLVVDVAEVDYVHLESDTRAIWIKQQSSADDQHVWHKQDLNP